MLVPTEDMARNQSHTIVYPHLATVAVAEPQLQGYHIVKRRKAQIVQQPI